jgi:hypothetical protein
VNVLQAILDEQDIRRGIGCHLNNWEKRLLSKIERAFDMVPCAQPNCGASYMWDDIQGHFFTCVSCGNSTCVDCQTLIHPGRTCAENRAIKGDDCAALGSDVQCCPTCKAPAVKDGNDCDRIICTECKSAFCAQCSAPYDGEYGIRRTDNSTHQPSCRNYRDPEEGRQPFYLLRQAAETKSKRRQKSESPPPTQKFMWTVVSDDSIR